MRATPAKSQGALGARRWSGNCFPIVSFLHVPGKMSRPLWLMMGTAFPFQTPPMELSAAPHAAPAPQLLLTAKHTFAPWDFAKDASQLKIPAEYQKLRFVVGRLYRPDEEGRAVAADAVQLRLVSQHPHLDVAVLAAEIDAAAASGGSSSTPAAATTASTIVAAKPPVIFDTPLALHSDTHYPAGASGLLVGYRGTGKLGELDTLDSSLLQRLPPAERESLLRELQDVEGKQCHASTTVKVLDEKGMCAGVGNLATCYHGMSGGPLLTSAGACAGVLYGHHPDAAACFGYTPCADIAAWLRGVVRRYVQRQDARFNV